MLAQRDAKRWREITHTIKGAARGVGAFGMGEAAAAAEPVDPANGEKAKAAIKQLEDQAASVRAFIQTYLAALKTPDFRRSAPISSPKLRSRVDCVLYFLHIRATFFQSLHET